MSSSNGFPDPEKHPRIRSGYPSLAAWIARDPDNETYVFRKFDRLSARNLLKLQYDMIELETRIDSMDQEMLSAGQSNPIEMRTMRSWKAYERHTQTLTPLEQEKQELEGDLKCKIKEYHEALLLQSQIASLDRPSERLLGIIRDYFHKPMPIVYGHAHERVLENRDDLAALRPPLDTDCLSCFVRNYWPFRGQPFPDDAHGTTQHFLESHVQFVVIIISTLFAAILLIGAITSLYFVQKPGAKLGLLAAFTSLFAASVGGLTSAKRQEVFAASAAYAAVLVVFVSGDFDKDRGG